MKLKIAIEDESGEAASASLDTDVLSNCGSKYEINRIITDAFWQLIDAIDDANPYKEKEPAQSQKS